MKINNRWLLCSLIAASLAALLTTACAQGKDDVPSDALDTPVTVEAGGVLDEVADEQKTAELLADLEQAYTAPSADADAAIDADLAAIKAKSSSDYKIAKGIADHWRQVYLDPDYRLCLYAGDGLATALVESGLTDSNSHAFVVLGYELEDGEMTDELRGRCEAAAAAARAYPSSIIVCSGGATGANNPDQHTEAGLMRDYLVNTCGISEGRIYIDEQALTTAENATNTMEILRQNSIKTMTIVTSSYHQRWGQAVYNVARMLYERDNGYATDIVGNFCYDTRPSLAVYGQDDRFAAQQMASMLQIPEKYTADLPTPTQPDANQKAAPEDMGRLLADLLAAEQLPSPEANQAVDADLDAILKNGAYDYDLANSIATNWYDVYINPAYPLYLYAGEGQATALEQAGLVDSGTHAFVVMGLELQNGEMTDELRGRCEAAAAAARSFPSSLIVCSGGPTGDNNPNNNTEAGLMRDYLVGACGIDEARIHTDETSTTTDETAFNTLKMLQDKGVTSMTLVTSSYHQRWAQAVYNAAAQLYARTNGYRVSIVANYNYDAPATMDVAGYEDQIAIGQIADVLQLPSEARTSLPNLGG